MKKKILIISGGISKERVISLDTGFQVAKELSRNNYIVKITEPDFKLLETIKLFKPDIIFNALHGQFGEDGYIQTILETTGIPYTHSGVISSAIAMDKIMAKRLMATAGIMVPQDLLLVEDSHVYPKNSTQAHVIKPRNDGSSVGVVIVKENDKAPQRNHWDLDTQLICEPFIPGRELTVNCP